MSVLIAEEAQNRIEFVVQNVVCNVHLGAAFDTQQLVEALQGRYDPIVFPAVVSKCKETQITNSCFASGHVVVSGARTEAHALLNIHMLVALLTRMLMRTDLHATNYYVTNIVSSCFLGFGVNLRALKIDKGLTCEHRPQLFPGAHWRITKRIRFVVFSTGYVISTGQTTLDQVRLAGHFLRELEKYEQGKEYRPFVLEALPEKFKPRRNTVSEKKRVLAALPKDIKELVKDEFEDEQQTEQERCAAEAARELLERLRSHVHAGDDPFRDVWRKCYFKDGPFETDDLYD